jgi:predicted Rossmann fold flavoprotein
VSFASGSVEVAADVTIVGAGAAGLATAVFVKRARPTNLVNLVDGAAKPGAKILVSGGGRCNVTNAVVDASDFWGGKRAVIRRVLNGFPVDDTIQFFRALGVPLHEEPGGKLFPDSNRARDVLDALLRAAQQHGVTIASGTRVDTVSRDGDRFHLRTSRGALTSRAVVLATGGRSLPKTGSDGGGYELARALGHTLVTQSPALAPLLLDPDTPHSIHARLSGVSVDVALTAWIDGAVAVRLSGAMLFTHFGISGPVAMNMSRHWVRARDEGRDVRLTANFRAGEPFDRIDAQLVDASRERPRSSIRALLAASLPDALALAILDALSIPADLTLASLSRDDRRRVVHALSAWPLPVTDTRGYNFAEVTAGGVPLTEIDPSTMGSRVCPGLFLVGEILDVDGRIGGFNFQWAWASAAAAARGVAAALG